jgi:tryptophan-rich sensory protein
MRSHPAETISDPEESVDDHEPASTWRKAGTLLLAVGVCEGVGAFAGMATRSSVETWYPTLARPAFAPPDEVFAPVWIALYALMGFAAWLVARDGLSRPPVRRALGWFAVQLALNGAWSFAFFGARSTAAGLVVILLLLAALLATTRRFFAVRTAAGWAMVPYAAWVAYAAALNGAIWWLN